MTMNINKNNEKGGRPESDPGHRGDCPAFVCL